MNAEAPRAVADPGKRLNLACRVKINALEVLVAPAVAANGTEGRSQFRPVNSVERRRGLRAGQTQARSRNRLIKPLFIAKEDRSPHVVIVRPPFAPKPPVAGGPCFRRGRRLGVGEGFKRSAERLVQSFDRFELRFKLSLKCFYILRMEIKIILRGVVGQRSLVGQYAG